MPETTTQTRVLRLDERDNVLIALVDLRAGEQVEVAGGVYQLFSDVPAKHKFAIQELAAGDAVIMYGVLVGKAVQPIHKGELISTRNLRHEAAVFHRKSEQYRWTAPNVSRWQSKAFLGYRRSDGQVGTRNHWLVVPLVFCENRNINVLKQAFEEELGFVPPQAYRGQVAELVRLYREGKGRNVGKAQFNGSGQRSATTRVFENVDGVKFLTHEGGCGGTREDANNLCGLIAGYIHHPNVAGATVLSLGCQHSQIDILRTELDNRDPNFSKPVIFLEQQKSSSEFSMLSDAVKKTFEGLIEADEAQREAAPLANLSIGLKCGGSDGFSGISANPAIGHVSDLLTALGGKTVLA